MTLVVTINSSTILHPFRATRITLPGRADGGAISFGGIPFEDINGDLSFNGLRRVTVEETACSQPRLFTGWIETRRIGRSPNDGLIAGTTARLVDTTLVDTNAAFGFRVISGTDGKRPEETFNARLAWIMGSYYLRDLISTNTTYCLSSTRPMEATDYIGQYPFAVLNDLATRLSKPINYFAFWDPSASEVRLFLDYNDVATVDSTLSISNAAGEANGTTVFAPSKDATLDRSPEDTYSSVLLTYAGGRRVFRQRPATSAAYTLRGATVHRPYTGKHSTAVDQAENWLRAHSTEVDTIRCAIIVPNTKVGLITAGQRVSCKFTHLPGYSSAQSMRVIDCVPQPLDDAAEMWEINLVLKFPRPEGDADPNNGVPAVVQTKTGNQATFPVSVTLDTAPTAGNLLIYWHTFRGGNPTAPTGWTIGPDGLVDHAGGNAAWFYKIAEVGESATIVTDGDNNGNRATVYEISGYTVIDTSAEDAKATTGSSVTLPATTVTPTSGAAVLLLAGLYNADSDTPGTSTTPPTGWTEVTDLPSGGGGTPSPHHWTGYYAVASASGSYSISSGVASYTEGLETQVIVLSGSANEDPGLELGTWVINETPTPAADGTTTTFTLAYPFLAGSLTVRVDLLDQTPSVVSQDTAAGTFTLAFAPRVGEQVTADYQVGA